MLAQGDSRRSIRMRGSKASARKRCATPALRCGAITPVGRAWDRWRRCRAFRSCWRSCGARRSTCAPPKPDLVVLVDFGVFNLRLATTLRGSGYAGPVLDVFPPGTWLDNPKKARAVSAVAVPMTAFAHQAAFYKSLGLPVVYFGHPLAGRYAAAPGARGAAVRRRNRRDAARQPQRRIAISFAGAARGIRAAESAASSRARRVRRRRRSRRGAHRSRRRAPAPHRTYGVVRGTVAAVADADAAWVASGTAVLETALCGVPAVALYIITPVLARHGRTMIKHRFITLPNLVSAREVVPELLQEDGDAGTSGRRDGRGAERSQPSIRAVRRTAAGARAAGRARAAARVSPSRWRKRMPARPDR